MPLEGIISCEIEISSGPRDFEQYREVYKAAFPRVITADGGECVLVVVYW
jgi:hypothetical protein